MTGKITYMDLKTDIQSIISGEIADDSESLTKYSKDASIFEITPKLIIYPKDSEDIKKLVQYAAGSRGEVSITPRSAGTCMSGGAINDSLILDMTKYFNKVLEVKDHYALTQPGVYYRDFEKETLKQNLLLPCYTASRELNTVGGMVGNNSAGEKTLSFGQTERYVKHLKVVLSDGGEYTFKPLNKTELEIKLKQKDFEGEIYRKIYNLVTDNKDLIEKSKPEVSKNSTGYNIWKVWDGEVFDINKIFTGSQGTLGVVTEIGFELITPKKYSKTLVISLNSLDGLDEIINEVLKFKPESFECYDDQTLRYAVRFLPEIIKDLKNSSGLYAYFQFLPELLMKLQNSYFKMVMLAEFTADEEGEATQKCQSTQLDLKKFNLKMEIMDTKKAEKYWVIRRQSFALLKNHSSAMRTAPFIDDIIVRPKDLPAFLPELNKILDPYQGKILYTIAGHIGNGNFHIIPLMDFNNEEAKSIIVELSDKVFTLVKKYSGSMAAEHNDGMVRGQYLPKMYGEEVYQLFKDIKDIFDPLNIFNPHKKTDATEKYSTEHIAKGNSH